MAVTETIKSLMGNVIDGLFGSQEEDGQDLPFDKIKEETTGYITGNVAPKFNIKPEKETTNVVDISRNVKSAYEVMFVEPRSFEDSATVVQYLKERKTTVINLHLLDNEQSHRTIDFLCGASTALNGKVQKIDAKVFMFVPNNVTLSVKVNDNQNKFNDSLWRSPRGLEQ